MAIGFGALGPALTQGPLDLYRILLEQRFRQQAQQQAQEMDFADWQRRQLFLQSLQGPERERQAAAARIQSNPFPIQQLSTDPRLAGAWVQWQRDYALTTGAPYPTTQTTAGAPTITIPGQRREEGGLARLLAPAGTQQIPSGQTRAEPILPHVAREPTIGDLVPDVDPRFRNVPISQARALGIDVQPPVPAPPSTVERIRQKIARGERLTPGEQKIWAVETAQAQARLPDPSQLTTTDKALFDIWFDESKYNKLPEPQRRALRQRVVDIFTRLGMTIPPDSATPSASFWQRLRIWWQSIRQPTPTPATGAPQRSTPTQSELEQFYK